MIEIGHHRSWRDRPRNVSWIVPLYKWGDETKYTLDLKRTATAHPSVRREANIGSTVRVHPPRTQDVQTDRFVNLFECKINTEFGLPP